MPQHLTKHTHQSESEWHVIPGVGPSCIPVWAPHQGKAQEQCYMTFLLNNNGMTPFKLKGYIVYTKWKTRCWGLFSRCCTSVLAKRHLLYLHSTGRKGHCGAATRHVKSGYVCKRRTESWWKNACPFSVSQATGRVQESAEN